MHILKISLAKKAHANPCFRPYILPRRAAPLAPSVARNKSPPPRGRLSIQRPLLFRLITPVLRLAMSQIPTTDAAPGSVSQRALRCGEEFFAFLRWFSLCVPVSQSGLAQLSQGLKSTKYCIQRETKALAGRGTAKTQANPTIGNTRGLHLSWICRKHCRRSTTTD